MTSSLPNSEDDKSDSGRYQSIGRLYNLDGTPPVGDKEHTCLVRVTPYDAFTADELWSWLENDSGLEKCLLATEHSSKNVLHYHIVASTHELNPRAIFEQMVSSFWPPGTRSRGFGNKQWNFVVAESPDLGMSYAIKHGEYVFYGYTQEYIDRCKEDSFVKPERKGFNQDFDKLRKDFKESQMTLEEFMTQFVILKSGYGQMVNLTHAYQYALSAVIDRNPDEAADYVRSYVRKLS